MSINVEKVEQGDPEAKRRSSETHRVADIKEAFQLLSRYVDKGVDIIDFGYSSWTRTIDEKTGEKETIKEFRISYESSSILQEVVEWFKKQLEK